MTRMRILMLPHYGRMGANSRYRLWQYLPRFEAAGHTVDVKPMLDDVYLQHLYEHGRRPLLPTLRGYLRHLGHAFTVRQYDAVLLDQELLPYVPAILEQLISRFNSRLIVDYDDACHDKYERLPPLRHKIGQVMAAARTVVVGNRYLEQYARQFARDVRLIPTVVDKEKYNPKTDYHGPCVRIGWIGTPMTASRYLPAMLPVFLALQRRFSNLQFRFIGAGPLAGAESLRVDYVRWAEATEARELAENDIGIMPLGDDSFSRGKCGLKLIQYMAAALPVVASPVGENNYIVDHGHSGYLAADSSQWVDCLTRLIGDAELRQQMGRMGREKVERQYSLAGGFEQWQRLLNDVSERALAPIPHPTGLADNAVRPS